MQGKLHRYNLTTTLAKKYSHSTYLASSIDEPEQQFIVIVYSSSLFSSPQERKTFLQKAQRLKELQHPHLLPILDMGIEKEQPFVVRDYLPNGSLRDHLKQISPKPLELHDALHIMLQVGEALAYAHQHNIFHGNLKPENILFDVNGKVLLADFTLVSKADALVRDQTYEEYAFCYMAPEQFAGTWDTRSDQYAIGYLTYELLAGQGPFATQTLTTMMGNQNNEPIPLPEKVADQLPSLNTAVLKALAKEPDERFFDFSLFLEVIRSVLSPAPAFPLLRSTTSHHQNTTPHPRHPLKVSSTLLSSHPSVACLSPLPKTSEASASPNAEHDLAELLDAPPTSEVHILKQLKNTPSSDDPFDDPSLINPATEQDDTESDTNLIDEEHGLEVDEMTVPLLNSTDRDVSLKTQTQGNRRKIFKLVPLGFIILAFVMAARSNNTAFLPLKTIKPDMLVQQKPTQVLTPQGDASPTTIPLTVPNPSPTLTIQPTTPNPSTTPTLQPTMPNPSTTPTIQSTAPSKATQTTHATSTPTPHATSTPTPPKPTPKLQTTTIDDSVTGTGTNQFNYVGGYWYHSGPECPGPNCSSSYPSYNNTSSWDGQVNDYVTLSFTGVQIKLYGVIDPMYGIGAVSIDGGPETSVDFYSSTHEGNQLLWTSPTLSAGTHTFKLRVTGNYNPNARPDVGFPPVLDRVDIVS
jgi:serine/threonine protein kinase